MTSGVVTGAGWANGFGLEVPAEGVTVRCPAAVPPLDDPAYEGVLWQASPGVFRLDVPGVARYLVRQGSSIGVDPYEGATPADVACFVGTTPLAALFLQRGVPVLHAAAVVRPAGDAVVLAGDSASGKSVLAAALASRGCRVIADDLVPMAIDDAGRPVPVSTSSAVRLWPDSAQRLGSPTASVHASCAVPVSAIWWLGVHNDEDVEVRELIGAARIDALTSMAYNSRIAAALLDRVAFLRAGGALAAAGVPIRRLVRPRSRWTADDLAEVAGDAAPSG